MARRLLLVAILTTLAGCLSPPVWRSASVSSADPLPTLIAASAFNYETPTTTVDLGDADIDWGEALEAAVQYAVEHPEKIDEALQAARTAAEARQLVLASIEAEAPALHERAVALLVRQGFAPEYDPDRADALLQRSARQEFVWVAPGTSANPFGNPTEPSGQGPNVAVPGSFPLMGDETPEEIAGFLRSGRDREAYASIQGQFVPAPGGPANGFTCMLFVFVIDPAGQFLFSGRTEGAGSTPRSAFDAALAGMNSPVVQP